jgi:hypothetical protein
MTEGKNPQIDKEAGFDSHLMKVTKEGDGEIIVAACLLRTSLAQLIPTSQGESWLVRS